MDEHREAQGLRAQPPLGEIGDDRRRQRGAEDGAHGLEDLPRATSIRDRNSPAARRPLRPRWRRTSAPSNGRRARARACRPRARRRGEHLRPGVVPSTRAACSMVASAGLGQRRGQRGARWRGAPRTTRSSRRSPAGREASGGEAKQRARLASDSIRRRVGSSRTQKLMPGAPSSTVLPRLSIPSLPTHARSTSLRSDGARRRWRRSPAGPPRWLRSSCSAHPGWAPRSRQSSRGRSCWWRPRAARSRCARSVAPAGSTGRSTWRRRRGCRFPAVPWRRWWWRTPRAAGGRRRPLAGRARPLPAPGTAHRRGRHLEHLGRGPRRGRLPFGGAHDHRAGVASRGSGAHGRRRPRRVGGERALRPDAVSRRAFAERGGHLAPERTPGGSRGEGLDAGGRPGVPGPGIKAGFGVPGGDAVRSCRAMLRRWSLGLGLSVLAHVGVVAVGLVLGARLCRAGRHRADDVHVEAVKLPAGGPESGGDMPGPAPVRRAARPDRRRRHARRPPGRGEAAAGIVSRGRGGPPPPVTSARTGPRGRASPCSCPSIACAAPSTRPRSTIYSCTFPIGAI
jgi:hypothetical protein